VPLCNLLRTSDLEEIGDLESYIDRTSTILIYCSKGYFTSKNCMRELVASVNKQKELIAMVDPDASRGGLSLKEVHAQLLDADGMYVKWGFRTEESVREGQEERTAEWHKSTEYPGGQVLYDHLAAYEPIEWNRIGHFQDVTMRLIAERLLPNAAGATYVDREIANQTLEALGRPLAGFHVYCSELNPGAIELMHEVCRERCFGIRLEVEAPISTINTLFATATAANLSNCDHVVLYLTAKTWTRGDVSTALGKELMKAIDLGIHVLLVHEMPGGGGQDARSGCEFATFFGHPDGATPPELLKRCIYSEIAVPLKGGAWREASMALLGVAFRMSKEDAVRAKEGEDLLGVEQGSSVRKIARQMRTSAFTSVRTLSRSWNHPPHHGTTNARRGNEPGEVTVEMIEGAPRTPDETGKTAPARLSTEAAKAVGRARAAMSRWKKGDVPRLERSAFELGACSVAPGGLSASSAASSANVVSYKKGGADILP